MDRRPILRLLSMVTGDSILFNDHSPGTKTNEANKFLSDAPGAGSGFMGNPVPAAEHAPKGGRGKDYSKEGSATQRSKGKAEGKNFAGRYDENPEEISFQRAKDTRLARYEIQIGLLIDQQAIYIPGFKFYSKNKKIRFQ